jgi:UDP-N-acetylglucosamine diphosphorylase / glucose-1-phosphate thymidylyltransferase / UDP-N-acetylgalactosamine diphosphorylase / glucosamine-1-phosphate N-acetyltransferase / galactosamine-1-phosphate N-acetyltransferase
MTAALCVFEDARYRRLLPLSYTRPVYDLRCGILTLREKIQKQYPELRTVLHTRSYLADLVRQQNPDVTVNMIDAPSCLFVNGRLRAGTDLAAAIPADGPDMVFTAGDELVAARVSGSTLERLARALPDTLSAELFSGLQTTEVSLPLIGYPWDLVNANGSEIVADFPLVAPPPGMRIRGKVHNGVHLLNPDQIAIGEGTTVKPGVVLDAEHGPILIGAGATIFPNAVIEGPAFIGDRASIKIGAKIYENTSIGSVCKVGGEVEASIIHSHSNKQHDGFLGHAYLGMWVNLGADTNNSDLKNNYGSVSVVIDGKAVDSGSMFVGLVMGDHSKSSINSMFNTGTVVGVSSNVFGSGFPDKFVPSFSWGGSDGLETYDLDKALGVARRVMGRRKMDLSPVEEAVLREIFTRTKKERTWEKPKSRTKARRVPVRRPRSKKTNRRR